MDSVTECGKNHASRAINVGALSEKVTISGDNIPNILSFFIDTESIFDQKSRSVLVDAHHYAQKTWGGGAFSCERLEDWSSLFA